MPIRVTVDFLTIHMSFWNQIPYKISPYLIQINGFGIRYYSLMYVLAFVTVYLLVTYRLKTETFGLTQAHLDDFIVWAAVGVLLGGRLDKKGFNTIICNDI